MNKTDIIRKLTSRKLWVAVSEFVAMLIVALGGAESTAVQATALIMAGAAVIAYIVAEGLTDAAAAGAGASNTGADLALEGIDVEDLTDDQLRSVLQQMGFAYTDDMTREQLLAALDEAAE